MFKKLKKVAKYVFGMLGRVTAGAAVGWHFGTPYAAAVFPGLGPVGAVVVATVISILVMYGMLMFMADLVDGIKYFPSLAQL